jgi:predicted NodU family carbamoyl transferase
MFSLTLDEHSGDWFDDLPDGSNGSPYMSITTTIKQEKCVLIPAVCHIDNTAR